MLDEMLKTVILGAPNFIGFIFAIWILNTRLTRADEERQKLIDAVLNCISRSEPVNGAERGISVERSGASHEEIPVPLTEVNDKN